MSEFKVEVIKVPKFGKHPNADSLSVLSVYGEPCVFRTGDFVEGELAVYVPLDAMVPTKDPRFAFLDKKGTQQPVRLKAAKLRGIYSQGLLVKADPGAWEGQDVTNLLGITKWVEPDEPVSTGGPVVPPPMTPYQIPYYDIEPWRKHKALLQLGEPVSITEKIHGANSRFVSWNGFLHIGSHGQFKADSDNIWGRIAAKHDLAAKLAKYNAYALFGETFGNVQDLKYGATPENPLMFRVFDIFRADLGVWLPVEAVDYICKDLGLDTVPELYRGPYSPELVETLCSGQSTIAGCIREGCVVKPLIPRNDFRIGRVILKLVSEAYHLRKGGTERK